MELLFNHQGIPLLGFSNSFFASAVGTPSSSAATPPNDDAETFDNHRIYPWASGNNFPAKVTGYKENGQETLEVIQDTELQKLLRSRMIRRYLQLSIRDVLKYGNSFPEFIFSEDGSKITGINIINARHCRWEEMKQGVIKNLFVYGNWKDGVSKKGDNKKIQVLDMFDPLADLHARKESNKLKGKSVIYPLRDSFSNNDYYPLPDWYTAKEAGWIDISQKIPKFLTRIYENQISWKWHVKNPYAYWEKRYPKTEYKDEKKRSDLIQKDMDQIEENLTGENNPAKALFTHFEMNHQGKPEEQWVIEPLDNKYKSEHQLIESAVADSNILFSINVNPTIMGAGLPGAGHYEQIHTGTGLSLNPRLAISIAPLHY